MAAPLDASSPPLDSPTPPLPSLGDPMASKASNIKLTADQLQGAGLDGLQPGDSFTVTITGTVTDNTDGLSAAVTMASQGEKETDEPGGDQPPDDGTGGPMGAGKPPKKAPAFTPPKGKIEMGPPKGMKF